MTSSSAMRVEDVSPWFDPKWRLNNLYYIQDKEARKVKFEMNSSQEAYYDSAHSRNVLLKARQRGFSTLIDLWGLDLALWSNNHSTQIIAHALDEAKKLFRTKVKFPYENMPERLRAEWKEVGDRADELVFAHGSSIRVSTSARSGTVQFLHVSEYGKIAATRPDKAIEIKTGAIEAVPASGMVHIESTAEGRDGAFYEMCDRAQKLQQLDHELTALDYKFHFHPWWEDPGYEVESRSRVIDVGLEEYFKALLAKHGVFLTPAQKAWYSVKKAELGEYMNREYPSTPEEAFASTIEGAYYANELAKMRLEKRVTQVPHDKHYGVNVFFDLGVNDTTALWFHQRVGKAHHLIDYYESCGEGLEHYATICQRRRIEEGYTYDTFFMPHDVRQAHINALHGEKVEVTARRLGFRPLHIVQRARNADEFRGQIDLVRRMLASAWIDEAKCSQGLAALDGYRRQWDERGATFKQRPLHNWASNGADSLRTGAVGFRDVDPLGPEYSDEFGEDPGY